MAALCLYMGGHNKVQRGFSMRQGMGKPSRTPACHAAHQNADILSPYEPDHSSVAM
jgi:hypothetical protein